MVPNVFKDSALDVLKMLPIMYLVTFLGELAFIKKDIYIRHINSVRGIFFTSLLGLVPQCGVAVGLSRLYVKRFVSLAVLMTLFLASSDEALIIAAGSYNMILVIKIIASKLIIGCFFGLLLSILYNEKMVAKGGNYEKTDASSSVVEIAKDSAVSVLKLAVHLFVIVFLLNLLITWVGIDALREQLRNLGAFQVIITSLIGSIPSCASSVFITQAYMSGVIGFGALISGLCANTGYGIIIIFKELPLRKALSIYGLLLCISIISGMFIMAMT